MNSSSPSARLRPFRPQPFGRYTLLSHLATGGMGEIYLARLEGAQGFEKLCVIKKILPQLAEDKEFVDRFVGEARTLVKLSHGSIAQVLDMGLHEGDAYMALEYVDGKDLRKVAGRVRDRQMPLPLTFVLFVMGRVLDALAYAHRKRDDDEKEINLVHRDVSPQNILISYEGEVKVIDFGLAKSRLSAAKTNPSIILGKFLYMSPEQARHQPVDRRSDLYAVGLCLYELISGKNPFDSVPPGELMSAVAQPRIPPLSEVEPFTPPMVVELVMKALAVEPSQRFQTAEEFRGRLMACLMEIDASAGPESVSRFMRDLFSGEFQSERKLLAQLKEVPRLGEPSARAEVSTEPSARFSNAVLPPRTIKLDGPVEPLSFHPTPRSRGGDPVHEGETRPGVVIDEETRPAVPLEKVERPAPPVALATHPPPPSRSAAPTVEVPIPIVPAAAIPPGVPAPKAELPRPLASAPRTAEPPRPPVPPASALLSKAPELSRPAAPPASAPSPRGVPPPPPASALPPEPRAAEVSRSQAPTLQIATPFVPDEDPTAPGDTTAPTPVPLSMSAAPAPREAGEARAPAAAPHELPRPLAPPTEPPVAPREPRGTGSRAAVAASGSASPARPTEPLLALNPAAGVEAADPSRRGLDDTHPSYQMGSSPTRPEDTSQRVVLDDAALGNNAEAEGAAPVVLGGLLDETPSSPSRPKVPRRPRSSSAGMPSVARATTGSRSAVARPTEPAPAAPAEEVAEEEQAQRDPREETRRTPIPTRPGEPARRIHREDTRKTKRPQPPAKRPWGWLALTVVVLLMAGGAVAAALPQLKHLLKVDSGQVEPPPPVPIRPVRPPEPSPESTPPPGPGGTGADPAAAGSTEEGNSDDLLLEEDLLIPLTPPQPPPPKKPTRTSKKGTRRDGNDLQKDWASASRVFQKLTAVQSCESPTIGILCKRYETLQSEVEELGDVYDKETHTSVRRLRRDLLKAASSAPQ